MFAFKSSYSPIGRAAALAALAAIALTAVEPSMAQAGSPANKGVSISRGTSDATDFSARRYYRGGGGAAAAAAFAGVVGTGIAIAASQNRYYDDSYGYYGGGPVYGSPGYYGGGYGGYYGNHSHTHPGGYNNPNAYYGGW